MRIFNTLSGKLEEFIPIEEGKINMYICGPTVYNYAHVGNMVPVVFFDCFYRYFKYKGYDVTYASNFTDVDDKIINAAIELNTTEKEITDKFIEIYLRDVKSYNCLEIDHRPKVTESIDVMIDFIKLLIEKDYAYMNNGDVYFRVNKVEDYGILSKQKLDNLEAGSRIEVNDGKENPYDFVLWKKTDKGITWEAPFGTGRPGWHTECVVMINKLFNGKIDIHGGGIDLKFPHHENEVAQSLAAWDHTLANYWMHNGHMMVNGEKMSKSLGNFILAHELRDKYSANIIRLGILKNHYRLPINISDELFFEASTIDEKVRNVLKQAKVVIDLDGKNINQIKKDDTIEKYMDDDFNTSNLVTYLLDLVKTLNTSIREKKDDINTIFDKINLITHILGLEYDLVTLRESDKELYNSWLSAREEKNFELADELRKKLVEKNIL